MQCSTQKKARTERAFCLPWGKWGMCRLRYRQAHGKREGGKGV